MFYFSQSKELLLALGRRSNTTYINGASCYVYINLLNVSVICISTECKSISPTIKLELMLSFFYYLWCSFFFSYSSGHCIFFADATITCSISYKMNWVAITRKIKSIDCAACDSFGQRQQQKKKPKKRGKIK